MPGSANNILISCASRNGPNRPCKPYTKRYATPATIGEIEKGISISTSRKRRPGKSNLVMDHAAATPKAVLTGTAISAVSTVSIMA